MIEFTSRNMRIWSRLGPSGALGSAAEELAKTSPKVMMMTADLSFFSGLERYRNQYPDKFYNFGIAEQNMIGAAGGLAKEGFIPFANTYASFCASRCMDQVRVNMAYMALPIKLIGLAAGFSAGILGPTHMSIEDVSLMRTLPNITIISPADCLEIIKSMFATAETKKPSYIRLTGSMNMPVVYNEDYEFEIGKAIKLREGMDVCIIATGSMVHEALQAAAALDEEGISCSVVNMHTIKPLDTEAINDANEKHRLIVTVEEHSIIGGLGSAVAEHLVRRGRHIPQLLIGVEDFFPHAGSYPYLLEQCGLTAPQIKERIIRRLDEI